MGPRKLALGRSKGVRCVHFCANLRISGPSRMLERSQGPGLTGESEIGMELLDASVAVPESRPFGSAVFDGR